MPLARLSRGPGMLARANARADLRRVASVATPMVLGVSLVATVFFGKAMLQQQATSQTADRTIANLVLSAPSAAGLSPGLDAAVRRLPGFRQASGTLATSVIVAADGANVRAFPARGVDAASLAGVVDLGIASGSLSDLHGNTLAVGTDGATRFGWHLGDRVSLWLGDGTPVRLRVAATFTRPLGFAEIVLPRALVAGHVTHPLDDAVFVTSEPAARRASVITRLDALAQRYPGLQVSTRTQYERQLASAARHQDSEAYALLGLIAAFCALALVNAIVMSTSERRREFALLRLIGAEREQIWTMIRAETLITAAFGAMMGTLVALPGLAILSNDLTGSPFPSVPLRLYGCLIAAYVVLAFAATVLPTRLALRSQPIMAMTAR
jgi:putative ABC transport system permease protein